jgi:hypothetical protein
MLCRVVWYILTDVLDVVTASIIALMMEEVRAPLKRRSIIYQATRRNIPEDSHLHCPVPFIYSN